MTEHFTRLTVSAAFYCPKCGKQTQHRIDECRKGPCLACVARLDLEHAAPKPEEPKQKKLFV
jgi:ribosomal protein L44E